MTRTKLLLISSLLALAGSAAAFGQYLPPNGTESFKSYLSPDFLGGGASVTSQQSPQADSLNPAASGAQQLPTLNASYLGLIGTQADEGWKGHIVNLGVAYPTNAGVFAGSAHFMTSSLSEVALGTLGELSGSFAKELFPDLLVGAGFHLLVGANGSSAVTWGLVGDLGFLSFAGDVGFMKNLRWGVVMQGIGKGFAPVTGESAYPPVFTPVAGLAFDLVDKPNFRLGLSGDLGFPEFQDVSLRIGAKATLWKDLSLTISDGADLQEVLNSATRPIRSFIPSVGLSYTFKANLKSPSHFLSPRGWSRSNITTHVTAAPMQGGVWAFGTGANAPLGVVDRTPPKIVVNYPKPLYISPNGDGIQDYLQFPLSITDTGFIEGYRFDVTNENGDIVRQIEKVHAAPKDRRFRTAVNQFLSVKSGIQTPTTLRWDGVNNDGKVVPDGTYHFSVQAWDDNGNRATSLEYVVHVKSTPPSITVEPLSGESLIFAPNSNSAKQTIAISQSGSVEDLWTGTVTDSNGQVVRTFEWKNSAPEPVTWDGKMNSGGFAPNGVYNYKIRSTDRAGNRASATLDHIVIDTVATPVSLNIDHSYFSPNGDGVKDVETLTLKVPVLSGVKDWSVDIADSAGKTVRTFSGGKNVPKTLLFDGKADNGSALPEGSYVARLDVHYINGNHPSAESPTFTIDLTAPQASITANYTVFSPVGNGSKNTITFYQDTTAAETWKGTVENAAGAPVTTFSWVGTADPRVVWNGHGDDGKLVPDGTYTYRVHGIDRAGNSVTSNTVSFQINTSNTPVFVSVEYPAFSPNGSRNRMRIYPQVRGTEDIQSYHLDIVNDSGATVRSYSGGANLPTSFIWEGFTEKGRPAPDGSYKAALHVVYVNGNGRTAESPSFLLDTKFPEVTATANWTLFNPLKNSRRRTVTITNTTSTEPQWEADILSSNGSIVQQRYWKGTAGDFVWDGTDRQGNIVSDGTYTYQILATNVAGNTTRAVIRNITVDTRPTPITITAGARGFSPVGKENNDTVTFSTYAQQTDGVDHWEVQIEASDGSAVRTYRGGPQLPRMITWDGKDEAGKVSPDGTYTANYTVYYVKGNQPTVTSEPVALVTTYPQVTATADRTIFNPVTGIHRAITITNTTSTEPNWTAEILDGAQNVVRRQVWKGSATSFTWDGTGSGGNVVPDGSYTYVIYATNIGGNTTRAIIPNIVVDTRPTPVAIAASATGFSPVSAASGNTIDFDITAAQTDGIDRWMVQIQASDGSVVQNYSGGSRLSSSVTWNGLDKNGAMAPDGQYTAHLQVFYAKGNEPTAHTGTFILDAEGPTARVTISPVPFAPNVGGAGTEAQGAQTAPSPGIAGFQGRANQPESAGPLTFTIEITDIAPIASWKLDVYDPKDNLFKSFSGSGRPPSELKWDGRSDSGELVSSAEDYPYHMIITDEYGNGATVDGTIPVDVLVVREGNQLRIRIASIIFAPDSDALDTSTQEIAAQNTKVLDRLAVILKRYDTYRIRIEGYAVSVYWNDPVKAKEEQQQVLIPLSLARAQTVKKALVERGIAPDRMTTVGLGAENPVVPNSNVKDRWKNRRVEFILIK